jgi:hypothetical protein
LFSSEWGLFIVRNWSSVNSSLWLEHFTSVRHSAFCRKSTQFSNKSGISSPHNHKLHILYQNKPNDIQLVLYEVEEDKIDCGMRNVTRALVLIVVCCWRFVIHPMENFTFLLQKKAISKFGMQSIHVSLPQYQDHILELRFLHFSLSVSVSVSVSLSLSISISYLHYFLSVFIGSHINTFVFYFIGLGNIRTIFTEL